MKAIILGILFILFITVYMIFLVQGVNLLTVIRQHAFTLIPVDPAVSISIYALVVVVIIGFILMKLGAK